VFPLPCYTCNREIITNLHNLAKMDNLTTPIIRKPFKVQNEQLNDKMTSEVIPGTYENGVIRPSKKLNIDGKREVLIVFKEKRNKSVVDAIVKRIKPVEKKVIDEAIELTELGEGFE